MPRAGVRMVGKTKGRFTHPTRLLIFFPRLNQYPGDSQDRTLDIPSLFSGLVRWVTDLSLPTNSGHEGWAKQKDVLPTLLGFVYISYACYTDILTVENSIPVQCAFSIASRTLLDTISVVTSPGREKTLCPDVLFISRTA